ncbi:MULTISPECIES: peptidoglycan DD-metalloendopeptidase family protein [Methylobacterium]|uniref:murein hydrolase activator EnvC family protein n=3 Tax=Methylobacterium TaxID=407 RepID=UPI0008E0D41B|nr:peptidoglycan DD-metalloendopeptidase family protein [Methylobacterium sp. yr596]MBZ6414963.1 peptidoglycan DD-metalloendopeptidase family protein [Methylobacterium sp.]SFF52091.1 Septal ring factor EnvC, activator of murein hydrolases AmiA and AmiB [Methylobacterium sp. yr596]
MIRARLPTAARAGLLSLAVTLVPSPGATPVVAQPAQQPAAEPDPVARAQAEKERRAESLRAIETALQASAETKAKLEREVAEIKGDGARLNQALIDAARKAQEAEGRISELEARLQTMAGSETALRRSLQARRGVIAEVLAALQRMGRRPPPAVLVRPEDVLVAIRTSMLLGAVVPELQGEAETLAGDLAELVRLRGLIATDQEALRADIKGWGAERQRLAALVAARQARLGEAESGIAAERERAAGLAGQARNLKDLVDRLDGDLASARRAAGAAREAAEAETRETRERFAAAALRDPARLGPKVPFPQVRGLVPRPVSGEVVRTFGSPDGAGGTSRGISLMTRPRGVVSSPADGWVAYAGAFRSYGRLLIINAGDGYYLLLAGMDQINVEVGQFVLAGEPVAVMGDTGSAPSAGAGGRNDPVLYVEFKKDGGSIDPDPWWAKGSSEKVRG